jgi:nucleoid-associated protein YgaU
MVTDTPLSADAVTGSYVVKKGDTLSHISKKYLNDANRYYEIASENRIENPDLIYPGQRIVVTTEQ